MPAAIERSKVGRINNGAHQGTTTQAAADPRVAADRTRLSEMQSTIARQTIAPTGKEPAMEYTQAVAEARQLVRRSEADQWRLAQLTYEQFQAGANHVQWAQDVGVSRQSAERWAKIHDRYGRLPAGERPAYSEAFQAVDKSLDVEGVYAERHQMEARRTVRNLPPAEKAALAREVVESLPAEQAASVARQAIRQPEVADRVLRDPDARRTVRDADDRYHTDHQREAKDRYELAEPRSVQIGAITAGEYDLTKARRGFEDALDNADTLERAGWPDDSRERFAALTRRAIAAGQILLAKLEGRDLDVELAELLRGEG